MSSLEFSLVPPFISRDYVSKFGKFKKYQVLYTPEGINPPPAVWIYKCATCKFFICGQNKCQLVSEEGDPTPNEIDPESWCILWTNRDNDPPFGWLFGTSPPPCSSGVGISVVVISQGQKYVLKQ